MLLMLATTGFFCAAQNSRDSVYTGTDSVYIGSDSVYTGASDSIKNVPNQKRLTTHNFHTTYEYTESNGARLVIQNSFPRGGQKYRDPNGKEYVYAVFWTQITNETPGPLEITIDFSSSSFEIPPSPGSRVQLFLSSDTITSDKASSYDYGLAIKSFLDSNLNKPASLKKTIYPKRSGSFYVVTLSERGVNGTIRAGLSLREQDLFYSVTDKEIYCGKINLRNLRVQ